MNKKLIIAAVGGAAAVAAVATVKNRSASPEPKPTMWDKMREGMEEMPEDFPPRIMFDNIEATRANSERILDLLERQAPGRENTSRDDIEVVATT